MKFWLKPDERPFYNSASKALSEAHEAVFKSKDRDVLGMSHGPFSGVNQALGIVLTLETLVSQLQEENKTLRIKLINLRTFSPNKGKNMNVTPNTNTVDTFDNGAQQPYYIDAEGNRVEIPFDVEGPNDGQTYSGSEAAQPVTAFIAEDAADHAVTVH